MKCLMEPDLLPLLPLDGLQLLPRDLPLLSSIGGGSQRVGGGGREGGAKERGRAKARGRPNRQRSEVASWIGGDDRLGEAAVRKRVREREERVRELMLWVFMRENGY